MSLLLKQYRRLSLFVVALLCLISVSVLGFHHHADATSHADCLLCVIGTLFSAGTIANGAVVIFRPTIECLRQPDATFHVLPSNYHPHANRAPPLIFAAA